VSVFDESDRAIADGLFGKIRALSESGPYHPGVTRPSYSAIETATLTEIEAVAKQVGLEASYDVAANLWIDVGMVTDPAIWIGSHVDSVPQGGNFDGLAGVVAGLLCLRKIKQRGSAAARPVRVVALRGEESAWFGIPYIGAKALLGKLTQDDLARTFCGGGETLLEHMKNCGVDVDRISCGVPCVHPSSIEEYWELHIEQGPVLVAEGRPIGIVTDIRGNMRAEAILITGQAGHSGTTPRELRHDAVFAFAEFITALDLAWKTSLDAGHDLVVTCGTLETHGPTSLTRIPDEVEFCLEWRSRSTDTLLMFAALVDRTADDISQRRSVTFDVAFKRNITVTKPAVLSEALAARAARACVRVPGATAKKMSSGAGHDAAIFANAGVPTSMIFVRTQNGSHNPDEAMDMNDFMLGVEVLYSAVTERLADEH
jgi:N-carbamoyl-L-amino-acid hydrolase